MSSMLVMTLRLHCFDASIAILSHFSVFPMDLWRKSTTLRSQWRGIRLFTPSSAHFLNDEGRVLPFRDRKRYGNINREFTVDTLGVFDLYPKPAVPDLYDPCKILNPFSIKKGDLAAYGSPFHV